MSQYALTRPEFSFLVSFQEIYRNQKEVYQYFLNKNIYYRYDQKESKMIYLNCISCQDLLKLTSFTRQCACGQAGGRLDRRMKVKDSPKIVEVKSPVIKVWGDSRVLELKENLDETTKKSQIGVLEVITEKVYRVKPPITY